MKRWIVSMKRNEAVGGWDWSVDFYAGVCGKLMGHRPTEEQASAEANQMAAMVSIVAYENREPDRQAGGERDEGDDRGRGAVPGSPCCRVG